MSAAERDWAHFLAPIKDLAENWNIDLAKDLEDYLDELDSMQYTFGDGATLNFAQGEHWHLHRPGRMCFFLCVCVVDVFSNTSTTHRKTKRYIS